MSRRTQYARYHQVTDEQLEWLLSEIPRLQKLVMELPANHPRYDTLFNRLLDFERWFEYLFDIEYRKRFRTMMKRRKIESSLF